MPILSSDMGEKVAGIQVGVGSLTKPSLSFQNDTDTGFMSRSAGGISVVVDGVEVLSLTADGIAFSLLTAASVPFMGAAGVLVEENANLFYTAASNILTATGGMVTAAIGPASTQQHTLPAVASDTVALIAATQTLTSKTFNLTSNTFVATSLQLLTAVTDETGTGALTFATSPALTTPLLGTPTSGVLTNCIGLPAASVVAGTFGAGSYTITADLTVQDQLIVSGAGPHAIGGAINNQVATALQGSFTGSSGAYGLYTPWTLTPASGGDASGLLIQDITLTRVGGTHALFATAQFRPWVLTGTAGTVTTGATVYISNAPSGGTTNYALLVDAGAIRLDGSLWVEATPTEGTAGEQLTSGGAATVMDWTAAACVIESKQDIVAWTSPGEALAQIVNTPIYSFRYREKNDGDVRHISTGDMETVYVGPMAHEAPWAMHYGGRILNPINAFGYTALSIQALHERIVALESRR